MSFCFSSSGTPTICMLYLLRLLHLFSLWSLMLPKVSFSWTLLLPSFMSISVFLVTSILLWASEIILHFFSWVQWAPMALLIWPFLFQASEFRIFGVLPYVSLIVVNEWWEYCVKILPCFRLFILFACICIFSAKMFYIFLLKIFVQTLYLCQTFQDQW